MEIRLKIFDIIFLVLLILKLTHVIDWSWWIITAPETIPTGIYLLVALIVGIKKIEG